MRSRPHAHLNTRAITCLTRSRPHTAYSHEWVHASTPSARTPASPKDVSLLILWPPTPLSALTQAGPRSCARTRPTCKVMQVPLVMDR